MSKKDLLTDIKSHEAQMADRIDAAIDALRDGSFWAAQIAIMEAAQHKAVIDELAYQLERMEVM